GWDYLLDVSSTSPFPGRASDASLWANNASSAPEEDEELSPVAVPSALSIGEIDPFSPCGESSCNILSPAGPVVVNAYKDRIHLIQKVRPNKRQHQHPHQHQSKPIDSSG